MNDGLCETGMGDGEGARVFAARSSNSSVDSSDVLDSYWDLSEPYPERIWRDVLRRA